MITNIFNFKNYKIISKDILIKCKINSDDNHIMTYQQILDNIKGTNPLNKFKALINLNKLYLLEKEKEKPQLIFNETEILFDILENYPEEFKQECLICLTCIESINIKLFKIPRITPTEGVITIILHVLDNPKEFDLEFFKSNLAYIKLLVLNKDIDKIINVENLYLKLINIMENVNLNQKKIIKKVFKILINLEQIVQESEKINNNNFNFITLLNIVLLKYEWNQDFLVVSLKLLDKIIYRYCNNYDSLILKNIFDKMIKLELIQKLMNYLDITDIINKDKLIFYALKILGNFAMVYDSYCTDKLIELNFLNKLKIFIENNYSFNIRKEAAWIISNIAAGTSEQKIKLYKSNYLNLLFDMIYKEKEETIKKSYLWALYNFVNINNQKYFNDLIQKGLLDILISSLNIEDHDILGLSLEALEKALNFGYENDPIALNIIHNKIIELNIINRLKQLLNSNISREVKNKISNILYNNLAVDELDIMDTDCEEIAFDDMN